MKKSLIFLIVVILPVCSAMYDVNIFDGWALSGDYFNLSQGEFRVIYIRPTNSTVVYFPEGISAVVSPQNKSCVREWIYSVCQSDQQFRRNGVDVLPTINDPNIDISLYLEINTSNISLDYNRDMQNQLYMGDKVLVHTTIRKKSSKGLADEIVNISYIDTFSDDFQIEIIDGCRLVDNKVVWASQTMSSSHHCRFYLSPKNKASFVNNVTVKYAAFGKTQYRTYLEEISIVELPFSYEKRFSSSSKKPGQVSELNITLGSDSDFTLLNFSFELPETVTLLTPLKKDIVMNAGVKVTEKFEFNNTFVGSYVINYTLYYEYQGKGYSIDDFFEINYTDVFFDVLVIEKQNYSVVRLNNPTQKTFSDIELFTSGQNFSLDLLGPKKFHEFKLHNNTTDFNYSFYTEKGQKIQESVTATIEKESDQKPETSARRKWNFDLKYVLIPAIAIAAVLIVFNLSRIIKPKKTTLDKEIEEIRKKNL